MCVQAVSKSWSLPTLPPRQLHSFLQAGPVALLCSFCPLTMLLRASARALPRLWMGASHPLATAGGPQAGAGPSAPSPTRGPNEEWEDTTHDEYDEGGQRLPTAFGVG